MNDDEIIDRMELGLKVEDALDRTILNRGVVYLDPQGKVDAEQTASVNQRIFRRG